MLHEWKTAERDIWYLLQHIIFTPAFSQYGYLHTDIPLLFWIWRYSQCIAAYSGWFNGIRPFDRRVFPFSSVGNADMNRVLGAFIGQVNKLRFHSSFESLFTGKLEQKKKASLWLRCYVVQRFLMLSYRKKDSLKPMFGQMNGDKHAQLGWFGLIAAESHHVSTQAWSTT